MGVAKPGVQINQSKIAEYLSRKIDALRGVKSQREIAMEIGYEKPNMISMFKRGEAKVPLDKVPSLAAAINVDPAYLFRLAIEQYWPDLSDAINAVFGTVCSKNEVQIIREIRKITRNDDPPLNEKLRQTLRDNLAPPSAA